MRQELKMQGVSKLRILHVTNYSLTPKPPGYFGVPYKITNGLIRLGHNVLPFADRDMARYLNIFKSRKFGRKPVNRKLLEVVSEFVPDLVLFGHADMIEPDTLRKIREELPTVKLAQWNVDPLFTPDNIDRINSKIDLVDATFCSTSGPLLEKLSQGKYNTYFMPNPVDLSIERHRNFEKSLDQFPFGFGMAVGNPNGIRNIGGEDFIVKNLINEIIQSQPDIRTIFPGFTAPNVTGKQYDEFLAQIPISLNFSRRNDVYHYSSDRISHTIGNGILTFVDRAMGLNEIFEENEIAFFSDKNEFLSKLAYFIKNDSERQSIAEAGWKKYHSNFNEKNIAKDIIEKTYK